MNWRNAKAWGVFARVLRDSDPATYARIDGAETLPEPAEGGRFLTATGRGLSAWHADGTEAIFAKGRLCWIADVYRPRCVKRAD